MHEAVVFLKVIILKWFLWALVFINLGCASLAPQKQGFSSRLVEVNYPYPVSYFSLLSQNQQLEMAYMDVPAQAGAPKGVVVLFHGKNFTSAYWKKTIESLSQRGFRVIVPDQIGFGKSSKPELYQYSFHDFAFHTKQLIDSLGVSKVSLVGHSMGGMLAARFALMHPEITEHLVMVNPIGLEDWKLSVPYQTVEANYQQELNKTIDSVREYQQQNYFGGQWKPEYDELIEFQIQWLKHPDYPKIARNAALTTDMIFTQPVIYEFPRIKVKTLLIIGLNDKTALGKERVEVSVADKLGNYKMLGRSAQKLIPKSRLVEIENVGHLPQIENFERYFLELNKFIN